MMSTSARLMAIVFYFIPSFGLLGVLGHWKLEQTPYSEKVRARFEKNNTVYLYNSEPVSFTDLSRYDYTSNTGPDYTLYTYFSLQQYFGGFFALLTIHVIINGLAKILCSEDFKSGPSSLLFKIIHCLENTNIPTVWMDWDEEDGTIEDHQRRHAEVSREMNVIIAIRAFFNAVMLVPIVYTGQIYNNFFEIEQLIF